MSDGTNVYCVLIHKEATASRIGRRGRCHRPIHSPPALVFHASLHGINSAHRFLCVCHASCLLAYFLIAGGLVLRQRMFTAGILELHGLAAAGENGQYEYTCEFSTNSHCPSHIHAPIIRTSRGHLLSLLFVVSRPGLAAYVRLLRIKPHQL